MENTINRKSEQETMITALRVAYVSFMTADDGGGVPFGDCYIEEHPEIFSAIYLSRNEVGECGAEDADWYRILYFDQAGRLFGAAVEMGGNPSGYTWMGRQEFLEFTGTEPDPDKHAADQERQEADRLDGIQAEREAHEEEASAEARHDRQVRCGCGKIHSGTMGPDCPNCAERHDQARDRATDNGVLQLTWCGCDATRLGFAVQDGEPCRCGIAHAHAHCGHCGGILQARKPRTEGWVGKTGPATATGGRPVNTRTEDGEFQPLPPRNDLSDHSPDGFNWGYAGSGPTQLALAIAADFFRGDNEPTKTSDQKALAVYIDLKDRLIAGLPGQCGFVLTRQEVAEAIKAIQDNPGRPR